MTIEAWHSFPHAAKIPGLIIQGDGSAFQWSNCAAATWAGLVVSQQQGHRPSRGYPWYPTGASVRNASGDRSGGILPTTLDVTMNRVYGIDLDVRIATIETVQSKLDHHFASGLLVQYWPISQAGLSGSPGFMGAHSVGLYGTRTVNGVIQWLVGDPLYDGRRPAIYRGMRWISRSIMIKAGLALVIDGAGTTMRERFGSQRLYSVFTTRPYITTPAPGPTPAPLPVPAGPHVVLSAPTTADERLNPMLRSAYGVTSTRIMRLAQNQPLFKHPGGPRVTRMAAKGAVTFLGYGDTNSWAEVLVKTGSPYKDKQGRPTGLWVPADAGPVDNR